MQFWQKLKEDSGHEIKAILLFAFAAISAISIYVVDKGVAFTSNYFIGFFGLFIARIFTGLVGQAKFTVPILMILYSVMLFKNQKIKTISNKGAGILLGFFTLTASLHISIVSINQQTLDIFKEAMAGAGGGLIGATIAFIIIKVFGIFGSYILVITGFILSILLFTNTNLLNLISSIIHLIKSFFQKLSNQLSQYLFEEDDDSEKKVTRKNLKKKKQKEIPIVNVYEDIKEDIKAEDNIIISKENQQDIEGSNDNGGYVANDDLIPGIFNDGAGANEFTLPPISLLQKSIKLKNPRMNKDISEKIKQLEDTLSGFGVNSKVSQVSCGPAITRFEIQPEVGTKVSKIVNLSDDIALNLAASQVRIEAPIPGKAAVGIEVPNKEVAMVHFRDVIETPQFLEASSKLSVALGMDIAGKVVIADLTKMPHLLIAGATGSGKSVCMNSLICSLLYKALPTELKLMIIDPKMVELTNFNGIPHLIAPVVTDSKKAATALRWMVNEMENRYEMFASAGVKDIARYNSLKAQEDPEGQNPALPYIVVLIDELADLMMVAPADVEDAICRLAQMARAAGIHLVVATQRPSVDVITGLIKANIPSRIAFAVSSQTDSRTILDMGGAEKLLGQGDMLYFPIGAAKPIRVQGAYVSDKEVEKIVKFLKVQGVPEYENVLEEKPANNKQIEMEDELLPEAVRILLESNQASISMLQRKLRIGYTRAARLIDIMEEKGIVGAYEGSKPRAVLISWDDYKEIFKNL